MPTEFMREIFAKLEYRWCCGFLLIIFANVRLEWPKILGSTGNGPFTRTYLIAGYSRGEAFSRRETRNNGEHRSGEEEK